MDVEILALDMIRREALLSDNTRAKITSWMDGKGQECSPFRALTAVAGPLIGGGFLVFSTENFQIPTLH